MPFKLYITPIGFKTINLCITEKFIRIPIDDIENMRHTIGSEEYDLDAIIFTDVGMEMQSVILSNSRLAPIQV